MKNMKIVTKLSIGFILIELLLIFSLYTGYTTAATIINVEDPQHYLGSYAAFTAVEFVIMMLITGGISVFMIRMIKRTLAEVIAAAEALAVGKVDIKLEKKSNDEMGMLVEHFQSAINNVRYQAQIAQEVADGNMMVEVRPKSEEDVMGIALNKMVRQNQYTLGNIKDAHKPHSREEGVCDTTYRYTYS